MRFDNLSILEGKSDIPEEMSAIGRRRVIGDCSVDRVFDRGGRSPRRECSFRLRTAPKEYFFTLKRKSVPGATILTLSTVSRYFFASAIAFAIFA